MEISKLNSASILKAAPLAGLIAAAVNAVLYFIGDATGLMDKTVGIATPEGVQPITLMPVIMASIVPSIVAGILLALLNRFTANPLRIFGILAAVFLLLSLTGPFTSIPGIPTGMALLLCGMHVVVGGTVWYIFNRFVGKSNVA
jgi:Family of unknown function (DUF6069)